MKAICKHSFPQLNGIISKGDIVEIEPILLTRDEIGTRRVYERDSKGNVIRSLIERYIIREKGTYIGYRFLSSNGEYYTDACIKNFIGYNSLNKIFKKL